MVETAVVMSGLLHYVNTPHWYIPQEQEVAESISTCVRIADPRVYSDVSDQNKMLDVVGEYLADMNATSKKPQQLVLFQFALEHVAHIARIITSPGILHAKLELCSTAGVSLSGLSSHC